MIETQYFCVTLIDTFVVVKKHASGNSCRKPMSLNLMLFGMFLLKDENL